MEVGTRKKPHKDRGSGLKSPSWRSPKRNTFMDKPSNNSDNEGSLLLSNPMATEDDLLSPSHPAINLEERTTPVEKSNKLKPRAKSPSFIRMIMGSIRHHKTSAQDDGPGDSSSDNEGSLSSLSQITFSASDSEKQRIEHLATLPRRPDRKKRRRTSKDKMGPSAPEDPPKTNDMEEAVAQEEKNSRSSMARAEEDAEGDADMADYSMDASYHSVGLDALSSLHDQLQILVRQDCDDEFAETVQDRVVSSLRNQIEELQKSVDALQETEYSLRISLKEAEVRALEAETKLYHQTQQCQRLEQRYYRLEHQYRLTSRKNQKMEKTLQKTAVLTQIEQHSPSRNRRPLSARSPGHIPANPSPNSPFSVKRHNSMEGLLPLLISTTPTTSLPPRIPSTNSLSQGHTETRV